MNNWLAVRRTAARVLVFLAVSPILVHCDDSCPADYECAVACEGGGCGGGGGGGSDGSGGSLGGGGSTPPAQCVPDAGEPISSDCGVFVSSELDGEGDGTKQDPFDTVSDAVFYLGDATRIYVCGDATFVGSITLPPGVSVFGGLSCADWVHVATNLRPRLLGDANVPTIIVDGVGETTLQDLIVESADATGFDPETLQGRSSIGLSVSSASMHLENVAIFVGNGAAGGDGPDQEGMADGRQVPALAKSFNGNPGQGCGGQPGPEEIFDCNGALTSGAAGGPGGVNSGGNPSFNGSPSYWLGQPDGASGNGESGAGWSCQSGGGHGEPGHDGPQGAAGEPGSALGTLTGAGYLGAAGSRGDDGAPGQGGGGGGGRKGSPGCGNGITGPTGGGGGAGGCGGLAGDGGGAGGASIGIASLGAIWKFKSVSISAGLGGAGGVGGDSQYGGAGGSGAQGGNGGGIDGCSGAEGGVGGTGGAGGGGRGGHSLGIAYAGVAPDLSEANIAVSMQAAPGGPGGNDNSQANAGAPGLVVPKQVFQ